MRYSKSSKLQIWNFLFGIRSKSDGVANETFLVWTFLAGTDDLGASYGVNLGPSFFSLKVGFYSLMLNSLHLMSVLVGSYLLKWVSSCLTVDKSLFEDWLYDGISLRSSSLINTSSAYFLDVLQMVFALAVISSGSSGISSGIAYRVAVNPLSGMEGVSITIGFL